MRAKFPPGPTASSHYSILSSYRRNPLDFMHRCSKLYGEFTHYRAGQTNNYLVTSPELIQYCLTEANESFHKGKLLIRISDVLIGRGLTTSEGELHKHQRRLLQQAFTQERLRSYAFDIAAIFHERISSWKSNDIVDISDFMADVAIATVCKTLFGVKVDGEITGNLKELVRVSNLLASDPSSILKNTLQHIRLRHIKIMYQLQKFIDNLVDSASSFESKTSDYPNLMNTMIGSDPQQPLLPRKQIRDEVISFLLAGHEPSAIALAWICYLLAKHPKTQARLYTDIISQTDTNPASIDYINNVPYAEMVIKEAMRLYPPVWLISRTVVRDMVIAGYMVTAGSKVRISPYIMHHSEKYFSDPEAFQPDRFGLKQSPYIYLPFGGGPRICIGQSYALLEMKIILVELIRKYSLQLVHHDRVTYNTTLSLRPSVNIQLSINRRNN